MSAKAWQWSPPASPVRGRGRIVRGGSMGNGASRKETAYDQLALRFAECFCSSYASGHERVWASLDRARAGMVAAGLLTADQAATAARWLLADLAQLAGVQRAMPRAAKGAPLGDGAAASLSTVIEASGERLHGLAAIAPGSGRRIVGDVTCAGVVACRACGRQRRLERSALLTPCPACGGEVFNRCAAS